MQNLKVGDIAIRLNEDPRYFYYKIIEVVGIKGKEILTIEWEDLFKTQAGAHDFLNKKNYRLLREDMGDALDERFPFRKKM